MDFATRQFERGLRSALDTFHQPARRARPGRPSPAVGAADLVVVLAVREHRLAPDREFVHQSRGISRLQARIEAEQAARQAGYQVGYVVDYQTGERS